MTTMVCQRMLFVVYSKEKGQAQIGNMLNY